MKRKAFHAALPYCLPIGLGFLFLAISYGFLMCNKGFSPLYPIFMSALIFAGSMEFVTIGLLLSTFNPLGALLLTLNSYGQCAPPQAESIIINRLSSQK